VEFVFVWEEKEDGFEELEISSVLRLGGGKLALANWNSNHRQVITGSRGLHGSTQMTSNRK
jgi:hypothetical protein